MSQPVVRRVASRSIADFDDQTWPVNVVLLILGGCLAGILSAHADFETPVLVHNGWVQLAALGLTMLALAMGAFLLRQKMQRRMQLAVLISLLTHFWLSEGMRQLAFLTTAPPAIEQPEEPNTEPAEVLSLPDYHWQDAVTPEQQAFEKPVDTAVPEAKPIELSRRDTKPPPDVERPDNVPQSTKSPEPKPVLIARAEPAASRRSEQPPGPQITRQEQTPQQPLAAQPIPQNTPRQQPSAETSQATRVERQPPAMPVVKPPESVREPTTAPQASVATLDRRETSETPKLQSTQPQAARQSAPAEMPNAAAPALAANAPAEPSASPAANAPAASAQRQSSAGANQAVAANAPASAREPTAPAPRTPQRAQSTTGERPSVAAASGQLARSNADQPADLEAAGPPQPQSQPGRPSAAPSTTASAEAPTRASGGAPGLTSQQQLDASAPADRSTANIASAAAQRNSASRADAASTATFDARPAALPRAQTGADSASAPLAATPSATPNVAATTKPADFESDAGMQVERSSSAAARGQSASAVGSSSIDVGRPTITSSGGSGRASGGGEPTISSGTRSLGRSTTALPGGGGSLPGESMASNTPQAGPAGGAGGTSGTGGAPGNAPSGAGSGPNTATGRTLGTSGPATTSGIVSGPGTGNEEGPVPGGAVAGTARGGPRAERGGQPSLAGGAGTGGGPLGRASTAGSLAGVSTEVTGSGVASGAPRQPAGVGSQAGTGEAAAQAGDVRRQMAGPRVEIAAAEGPGGLATVPTLDGGVRSRQARRESDVVALAPGRMLLPKAGGETKIDARVRDVAVPGFKQRDPADRRSVAESRGGSAGTERAVELGLEFLARHQSADGSWSLHNYTAGHGYTDDGQASMRSTTAATGLALLAFLGAGYTHTDGRYGDVVRGGLEYLLRHQTPEGDLFVRQDEASNRNVWLYSHGMASIALCEAYGMTRDRDLRGPAQRALNFIVQSQEPQQGGWRYSPRVGSDTSVSGWQLMALKSGELAGLDVPRETYVKVVRWLDHAQGAGGDPAHYAYRPRSEFAHQRQPSRVMTAEALLMRQYLGWRRENPHMVAGAEWLQVNLPRLDAGATQDSGNPRDAYYWYYATQVMFQMQGEHWRKWNARLHPLLVDNQLQTGPLAGSWDPLRPVPDRWGSEGGRIYVTALHLLMLEVYYRHLPIYQTLDSSPPAGK